ncbi:MAG: hypothetical protein JJU20_13365 [Opitutales bacterium]|nr:hypothetical protein [Opitutales bacterium]
MSYSGDKARGPEELADLLETKEPVFLVGGQAVNLWALHYYERTIDLAPFVSRDVDLLGDRSTLEEVASLAKAKPQFFATRPPTNALGVVIAHDKNGEPVLIEVLKYIRGVSDEELREPSYTFEIGEKRISVCVPGPVALFKAKAANLADINQDGRQDAKHLRILSRILPDYWKDVCAAVFSGKLKERKLIGHLEMMLDVIQSSKGQSALKNLSLNAFRLFDGLDSDRLSKVRSFCMKRLPQAIDHKSEDSEK